jgi:hypothetical protein
VGVILSFISRNWKILLVLFALGGTATVAGVIPGLSGVEQTAQTGIESAKTRLVSTTETVTE